MRSLRRKGRLAVTVIGSLSLAAAACSAFVKFDATQCATDQDCAARGSATPLVCSSGTCVASVTSDAASTGDADASDAGAPQGDGGPWGCVGLAPPNGGAAPPSTITIVPTDGLSTLVPERNPYTVRTGVSVRLCAKRDPTCASPIVPSTVVDSDAGVVVPTPSILDFYIEVTGANVYPVIHFTAVSSDNTTRLNRTIYVGTLLASQTKELAQLVGVNPDPAMGIVLARPLNCAFALDDVAGIAMQITPIGASTVPFYTKNGLPSKSAIVTDKDGLGGFINEPPGEVTVETYFPADDAGAARASIGTSDGFTRAGWMTIFEAPPTAR